jgi:malate/lactate dehydrogenase
MAVPTDGSLYGVPKDLIFSFPCTTVNGKYEVVQGIEFDEFAKKRIELTTKELLEERNEVENLLH